MFISIYMTQDTPYFKSHVPTVAALTSVSIFLFYFANNSVYWLYGYKQWVISVYVPQVAKLSNSKSKITQRKYNIINMAGLGVIFAVSALMAVFRYFLITQFATNSDTRSDIIINMVIGLLTEMMLLFSAILLYKALKRFQETFANN